jgi:glycosyltransferase involved in cell wall biosynthesis
MPIDVLLISEARIATVQLLEQLLEHLRASTGLRSRSRLLHEVRPDDITADTYPVIVRAFTPEAHSLARIFHRHGIPFGFYLDDNFWLLDPRTDIGRHYAGRAQRRRLEWVVRNASTVIASTPLLRDYLRAFNQRVVQLDSFFDFSLIPELPPPPSGTPPLRGGFAASVDRIKDLEPVIAQVIEVLDEHPELEFEFIGGEPFDLPSHPRIRAFPYRASYADYIAFQRSREWDFALAPLGPAASNLYKTDNKFREYAAQGIPGIYQDEAPYRAVRDGETGLFAGETRSWGDAIRRYLAEPELRAGVRRAARLDAEERTSLANVAPRWEAFFASLDPQVPAVTRERVRRALVLHAASASRAARRGRLLWDYGRSELSDKGLVPTLRRTFRFVGNRMRRR